MNKITIEITGRRDIVEPWIAMATSTQSANKPVDWAGGKHFVGIMEHKFNELGVATLRLTLMGTAEHPVALPSLTP